MGRRNTAKTGDKAVYNSRPSVSKNGELRLGDDKFMRVGNSSDDDSVGDDGSTGSNTLAKQNVMDLGIEEGSDSSDESSGDEDEGSLQDGVREEEKDSYVGSSSGEEDSSLENNLDSSRWGKKKSLYYHGDTADIEIGQEKEDAFDEEEAAKEVESSRFQVMDDDDFMPEETSENDEECKRATHAANALFNRSSDIIENVGATKEGQQYLLTKSILGTSAALNAAIYLLLKQDANGGAGERRSASDIQCHPVMAQLQKCVVFADALKQDVGIHRDNIEDQISYLIQAIAMMDGESGNQDSDASMTNSDEGDKGISVVPETSLKPQENDEQDFDTIGVASETVSSKIVETEDYLMNEAKFGLRASEVVKRSTVSKRRKESADNYFGDLNNEEIRRKKHFLSTINTLEQKSRKEPKRTQVEEIDETAENSALVQGLNMMEEELRTTSYVDEQKESNDMKEDIWSETRKSHPTRDFYSAVAGRSKQRKAIKKKLYEVAPKFPGTVAEVSGERAISRAMLKNRGLVAHKAKINRNPRVKKREQYRKALISRKGTVREIRTSEGHKYSGEETGIKSGISRSRKL